MCSIPLYIYHQPVVMVMTVLHDWSLWNHWLENTGVLIGMVIGIVKGVIEGESAGMKTRGL